MAKQVARGQEGQLSQGTLRWVSTGGRRRPMVSGGGGRRAFCFWRLGRQVDTGGAHGSAVDGKEEERERQGNTGGEVGEMAWCLYRLGPGRTRGTRGRTRGLSGPTYFGPKSERVWTTLSVWVAPLGRVFFPRGHIRTAGGRLG
jgi:hypothetical protein